MRPLDGPRPLDGLRVLEVSSFVAAPLGGMTLAQLGAEVVRVDPPGGAPDVRRWPLAPSGRSIYWAGLNKGKRSVVVDQRSAEGREIVARLAAATGIVLTNARRPSYADLVAARPDVIHLAIEGRHDGSPAVDYTVNAEMGFPLVTGPAALDGPVNNVVPAWDVACGLYAAVGVLAAERHRVRTGEGRSIRLPLADVALAMLGNLGHLGEARINGAGRPRIGNDLYGGFGRDFATSDGRRVMIVVLTERHFADLGAMTGTAEVLAGLEKLLAADFGVDGDRYRHREAIAGLLAPWFADRTLGEVSRALAATSVLWAPYRTFAEVAADPAVAANPLLAELDQPGIGRFLVPGSPLDLGGDAGRGAALAPEPGGDTGTVLAEMLAMGADEIADLTGRGVVGGTV
ncbi:CoA transferase [Spirillospora sp. CA-294931]|uniref:CoA transferase n=1 Tax=Spirillospora sp. CA-294931 TaxID=3240042 RepID=UPI003D8CF7E5